MGHRFAITRAFAAVAALVAMSACTVHQASEGPDAFGPSDLALSFTMTATPDSISWDGASQSSVVVTAIDANGQPKSGVVVRLELCCDSGGNVTDVGTGRLSARTVVTGSDGRATVIYTAPSTGQFGAPASSAQVSIIATPSGSNSQTIVQRQVDIRLVAPGVILPPAETPTAAFSVSAPTTVATSITFDGSSSCPGALVNLACVSTGTIASYAWAFGDGTTGSGRVAGHSYSITGTYAVTLTVTNDRGLAASTTQNVTIAAVAAPSGYWTFSPPPVYVNQQTFFNADGVRAAPGHTLTQFTWNFGDGTAVATGFQASHTFTTAATYTVTLSVADDAGQKFVISKNISVGSGSPNAVLTVTKTGGNDIRADGGSSTATGSATISTYTFDFGSCSGTGQSGSQSFATKTCAVGTHNVRLTVTDSLGRSSSTTQSVTVP